MALAGVVAGGDKTATPQGPSTVLQRIGDLEGQKDPKCYATAARLEDFMFGTPLDFDARSRRVKLQKQLVSTVWQGASVMAKQAGLSRIRGRQIREAMSKMVKYRSDGAGNTTVQGGTTVVLRRDDLRQYSSVAYALRAILAVEQDSILSTGPVLLPLDPGAVDLLKEGVDIYTLAALRLADRSARMVDAQTVTAEMIEHAWWELGASPQAQPQPAMPPAGASRSSRPGVIQGVIEQKLASYKAYNSVAMSIFLRNLQVYFARFRWPQDAKEGTKLKNAFNEAEVAFVSDCLAGADRLAEKNGHGLIRAQDVHGFVQRFLPNRVNKYEDVTFFPELPRSRRITVDSYDLDAFRDSGLHWQYLKWALDDPRARSIREPDPFAAEILAEAGAQFGLLLLRVAGSEAQAAGAAHLKVEHLIRGMRRIQELLDANARAHPKADVATGLVSSDDRVRKEVAEPTRFFSDVTAQTGIDFEHRSADWLSRLIRSYALKRPGVGQLTIPPAFGGSGVAAEDVDNDGDPDVLLLSGTGNRLFLNEGGRFRDVTEEAGLVWVRREDRHAGEPRQPIISDFDNDGRQDILITYVNDDHRLYRNLGDHRFQDVTEGANLGGKGLVAGPATALDFDNDGLLDLYIGYFGDYLHGVLPSLARRNSNGLPNRLFRNLGGMRFEDVTVGSGVDNRGWTQAVGHTDFDRDGRQDLICGNDFGVNSYYRNLGGGKFVNVADKIGTDKPSYTMNIGIADLNRDAYPDIYISNIVTMDKDQKYVLPSGRTRMKFDPATLAHMRVVEANDLFMSRAGRRGLEGYLLSDAVGRGASSTGWSWDADFFDFDNDGDDDLYCVNGMNEYALYSSQNPYFTDSSGKPRDVVIPVADRESNVFFVNRKGKLLNESEASGADLLGNSRSVAYLDYNGDGDLDMVVNNFHGPAVLYRNNSEPSGNHWIGIRLVGDPSRGSTRDAVGAVILVSSTHHKGLWREIHSTTGYLSVHPKEQLIGIGSDEAADVTVNWPGGGISHFRGLHAGRSYTLSQRQPGS